MMNTLSDFVGADMSDVDRYVLKQGSTMVGVVVIAVTAVGLINDTLHIILLQNRGSCPK